MNQQLYLLSRYFLVVLITITNNTYVSARLQTRCGRSRRGRPGEWGKLKPQPKMTGAAMSRANMTTDSRHADDDDDDGDDDDFGHSSRRRVLHLFTEVYRTLCQAVHIKDQGC